MTIAELIDYLGQFKPETRVVLSAGDITDNDTPFIALDVLYFGDEGDDK